MIDFALLRHKNFLASNLSQMLAGAIELGLGFLTPFFLLLVVGVSEGCSNVRHTSKCIGGTAKVRIVLEQDFGFAVFFSVAVKFLPLP